MTNLYLSQKK